MKKYIVRLTEDERERLRALTRKGKAAAYKIKHANILLNANADGSAWTDKRIAEAVGCHVRTVENVRRRCVLEGLEAALQRKEQARPRRERKLDGDGEARLIALACSEPPEGRDRWTLQLLAEGLVRLKVVDSICAQTVRRTLKKTSSNPTASSAG
jgi:transposase|tara:strand:+ start:142 stop:609 length:468 start_codon:yes stop_codon:yes gene_type:complete